MKHVILCSLLFITGSLSAIAQVGPMQADSSELKNDLAFLSQNNDTIITTETTTTITTTVVEGNDTVEISNEQRELKKDDYFIFKIRKPFRRNKNPHFAGFGMGFTNLVSSGTMHSSRDISLVGGKSFQYDFNFIEHSWNLRRDGLAIAVTGLGIRWNRYFLDGNNTYLKESGQGITEVRTDDRLGMDIKRSRFQTTFITVPMLIERQFGDKQEFFMSFGAVAAFKLGSFSRATCYDHFYGTKSDVTYNRDLNVRPVNADLLFQTGGNHFSLYARYGLFPVFEDHKGPDVHSIAFGAMILF
ncbi:MAG: hypothetical protein PHI48_03590 [Bacteroidales bacterium]|nr:hypothetical protein [Bacteroidales bacterium]MDD4821623.1 hypothetical protein [Bacteroidales bacterium]